MAGSNDANNEESSSTPSSSSSSSLSSQPQPQSHLQPPPTKKHRPNDTTQPKPSVMEPETVKPEWLELPPELASFDFTKDDSILAWNKCQPYSDAPPMLVPVDTPPPPPSPSTTTTTGSKDESTPPALVFHLHATDGRARAATLHFPANSAPPVPTPRFMPVGTKGTIKSVLPEELSTPECGNCPMILANTYHLALQPGTELIDTIFGGLPTFMGGVEEVSVVEKPASDNDGEPIAATTTSTSTTTLQSTPKRRLFNLLTDSGGFQMVSLAALSQVTEQGVVFESPYTKGECMTLTPEDSIRCQNEIGADVIMQLDDVISSVAADDTRFRLATLRTLRWYDRCVAAHTKPNTQNLFPILQGHLDCTKGGLRELCLAGFRHRDLQLPPHQKIPGFAIGGLAGGEAKEDFWKVVDHACRHLPDDRPRYLMGVGYPLDLVVCTALGVDQYDCVYPTRTARFGVALLDGPNGQLKLKQHEFGGTDVERNAQVIDPDCACPACSRGVSRGRLHSLLKSQNVLAIQLLTQHNVCYMMALVMRMRSAILKGEFATFCRSFLQTHFSNKVVVGNVFPSNLPQWVQDAMAAAGIDLSAS